LDSGNFSIDCCFLLTGGGDSSETGGACQIVGRVSQIVGRVSVTFSTNEVVRTS
jgi:hypothetical protein